MITCKIYLRGPEREYVPVLDWNDKVQAIFGLDPEYYDEVKARIEISSKDIEPLIFDDNLGPMIQNLCLYGAKNILEGKDYNFRIWSYSSEVNITLQNQTARIEGEFCGTGEYPARELAHELISCAGKGIAFLKLVPEKFPESSPGSLESLEKLYLDIKETTGS